MMPRSLRVKQDCIGTVKRALKYRGFLSQQDLAEDVGVVRSTVSRFMNGETVDRAIFEDICLKLGLHWQKIAAPQNLEPSASSRKLTEEDAIPAIAQLYQDWGEAPESHTFYGRTDELARLEQWVVQEQCRLVAILGMGGIGKTTLLAQFLQQIVRNQQLLNNSTSSFQCIIWRSLLNAPPIEEILAQWIRFLSNQHETQLPENFDDQLSRLRYYLQTRRCLLILDNFEAILAGGTYTGQYQAGYERYGQLLEQVGKVAHQSCLLLTTREKPKEISKLEGKKRPVRSLELLGLGLFEAQHIFLEIGDFVGSEADWQELIQLYSGNPLGLELAAKHIEQVFSGNIYRFLQEGKPIFYDLLELLNCHFKRLSDREKELVYWLAIHREPVTLEIIKEHISCPITQREMSDVLQSLQRRWTLEHSGGGFTLQPVLMEYTTGQLVTQMTEAIEKLDTINLNQYAVLKATAKEYIREAQYRLIAQPIIKLAIAHLGGRDKLEIQLKRMLARLRADPFLPVGYAAGNLLNLFCCLNINLKGYNFSYLPIWQAYLQGTILHSVDFTGAQFVKSVFMQTFGNVLTVAFNPEGSVMATGHTDSHIYLWDVGDGQHLLTLQGHTNWVRGVSFSPDGKLLISGSEDQTIKIWDLQDSRCIRTLQGHTLNLRSVTLSPDGNTIISASDDRTIRLWDLKTGECFQVLEGHNHWVLCANSSPNGKQIVSGSCDQTIRIWDVETGSCLQVLKGHQSWVVPVSFSPDGRRIVSAGFDQTVRIWSVETGECLHILNGHTGWVWCAGFSPNGKYIASTGVDQTIRIWDAGTGHCLQAIQEHKKQVWAVIFHPDEQQLVSCGDDQTIRFWNMQSGQCLRIVKGYVNWIRSVTFGRDGQTIVSAYKDQTVKIWDTYTHCLLHSLEGHTDSVMAVACTPDGRYLASAGEDQTIRIWQVEDYRCLCVLTGHTRGIWAIAFGPDSRLLISAGCDNTVRVWDVQTAACLHVLREHSDRILSLAFSPTQPWVASASEDQTIKIWDVISGECVRTILEATRVMSVAFSPDGQTLASGSLDNTIKLWDINNGQQLHTLSGHTGWVMTLAFSPDGKTLASGSCDQTVKIWRISKGECINNLESHKNWIWSVAYSPDGRTLISSSEDETIGVWEVQTGQCIATLRAKGPYDGMRIAEVIGLTPAQKSTLIALGAVESTRDKFPQSDNP